MDLSESGLVRKAAKVLLIFYSLSTASGFLGPRTMGAKAPGKAGVGRVGLIPGLSMSVARSAAHPHLVKTHELRPPEQPAINCYPMFPRAAVNIVVVRGRPLNLGREYLFVQRSKEPGTNQWSLPGGSVEVGEQMLMAAAREVLEETTLDHNVLQFYPRCFMTTDAIFNDEMGAVKYHFVISQMVCWASPDAVAQAADDAKAVKWMTLPQLRKINAEGRAFRGVVEVIETLERLVDVGCITKADLVRVNAHTGMTISTAAAHDANFEESSSHLIPRRM